ncbi:nuclear pore complex protein NUP62-like [Neltuma alba]|uniref:nuclear pore complex protein NUP62-like n=1 Tax=Neltuma alba TaxID=207710 RepID=UPI0010A42D39|nr:nuclear pore complex protein NUP62-like [Prosopis alba]
MSGFSFGSSSFSSSQSSSLFWFTNTSSSSASPFSFGSSPFPFGQTAASTGFSLGSSPSLFASSFSSSNLTSSSSAPYLSFAFNSAPSSAPSSSSSLFSTSTPASASAPSLGFGSTPSTSAAASSSSAPSLFSFSSAAPSSSSSTSLLFGQSSAAPSSSPSVFGASSGSSLFGSGPSAASGSSLSGSSAPSLFGSSASSSNATSSLFASPSSAGASSGSSLFGASSAPSSSTTLLRGTTAGAAPFGAPATSASAGSSASIAAAGSSLFAASSASSSSTAVPAPSSTTQSTSAPIFSVTSSASTATTGIAAASAASSGSGGSFTGFSLTSSTAASGGASSTSGFSFSTKPSTSASSTPAVSSSTAPAFGFRVVSSAMAPETRSSDCFAELQEQLDLQKASIASVTSRLDHQSQAIDDLRSSTAKFDDSLKDILNKVSSFFADQGKQPLVALGEGGPSSLSPPRIPNSGSLHEVLNPPQHYIVPTKQSRVEFPKFDGSDFRGWAYRCQQFFEVDGTPPDHRIRLLSIHLEGHALRWHQTFMRHKSFSDITWFDYFREMEKKFADIREENPMIALKELQQLDGSVIEYEQKFDELLSKVDIPDEVAMSLFIGGLRADIQRCVLNFNPSSLASAMHSARMQELTIRALHDNTPAFGRRMTQIALRGMDSSGLRSTVELGSISCSKMDFPSPSKPKSQDQYLAANSSNSVLASSPRILSSPTKPSRQLSKKEMDERRRKGLCFWCLGKYTSSHCCKDSHLFRLVIDDDEESFEEALEEVPVENEGTINANEG